MKLITSTYKKTFALALLLALLLPSTIQFSHIFGHQHEHKRCTNLNAHLHEKKLDCSIDSFHFSSYTYIEFNFSEFSETISIAAIANHYTSAITSAHFHSASLRGPPHIS